jgi:hypothetical protein
MMVADAGVVPVFVAVNEPILPVPDEASPIEVFVFVQLYVVPLTAPVNVTVAVLPPLHTVWSDDALIVGVGLTVNTEVSAHPPGAVYVITVVPPETPVITPEVEPMVATDV